MNIEVSAVSYYYQYFLRHVCQFEFEAFQDIYSVLNCECKGKKVDGMPDFQIAINDENVFILKAADYFYFPIKQLTTL